MSAASEEYAWSISDERQAAGLCYTSGTTGNPKGVVYSHRSTYLHSMAVCMGVAAGLTWQDRVLPIVPMFHANAWGLPYAALLAGSSLVMPDRWLQAEPLVRFMVEARPTMSGGVPTVWNDVLGYLDEHPSDLSSLRLVMCGGSAVPVALQQALQDRHGITVIQGWGMTETSPVASFAYPPLGVAGEESWRYRGTAGRVLPGVEARIVGDDGPLPADGVAAGELEVRGPWVTGAYYRDDDPGRFVEPARVDLGDLRGVLGGQRRVGHDHLPVGGLGERSAVAVRDRAPGGGKRHRHQAVGAVGLGLGGVRRGVDALQLEEPGGEDRDHHRDQHEGDP
jgi:fatty-acyl-CoA synthase